ncbi:hypothetical protein SARC_07119 [Sphaeroforma arctica JP610]|uniref:EndoU domain-containing protein n=1 Tax=Sphaeroforma arctica JP610 TaxID=667725 RepID=A0A0L0FVD8_9EUKA|nr:hypothetical protein SARC_07119 [Sphaeroforma arctica JP610]KNC80526.1 hypothetical protein SARC_07119 [Sphaeroforma arctica JP610]|eukprot:XP_014154428.1 hypothetical protein SARC_07119 [Sphaeroforma arctica JP610]
MYRHPLTPGISHCIVRVLTDHPYVITRGLAETATVDSEELETQLQPLAPEGEELPAVTEMDDILEDCINCFRNVELNAARESAQSTDAELDDLSLAAKELWELDTNRLEPDVDYHVNLQDGKDAYQSGNAAEMPLFQYVDKHVFRRPTFAAFYKLLDNYERSTGQEESASNTERAENSDFLTKIMRTPCMEFCYNYCREKGALPDEFYRRDNRNDSSGFEHVFVGEERDGKVIGLHNLLQLLIEERRKALNYKGYVIPRRRTQDPTAFDQVLTLQFEWEGELEPVSTCFIGVSPEFEMALYTLMFLCGGEENEVTVGGYDLTVVCHKIGRTNPKIGSAFPKKRLEQSINGT